MSTRIQEQLSAFGAAQVLVVLKASSATKGVKPSAALAAAIPVAASRAQATSAEKVVLQLGKHFRFSETSSETALATAASSRRGKESAGASWYRRAQASNTPAARYFPNLGLMLGTVDSAGLKALRAHAGVANVTAAPVLRLIRPVRTETLATKKAKKAVTWGIRRLKADKLHAQDVLGQGIVVGHLDTGADGKHPALKGALHAFAEFDDMGFQVTPSPTAFDSDEHGTHTAGTIAGRTVAGRAIGVAPRAKLASAIVIEGGDTTARVLAGMDWIISQGARVLSMSLGFPGYTADFLDLTRILRERGVLPVFAVGNEGPGTSRSPGNYQDALSIGAMGSDERVADFSSSREFSFGPVPDLVAAGVSVLSARPGGGYQEMDGTSMATPHVAGLAALLLSHDPSVTIDRVEKAILGSCKTLAGDPAERQGAGVPDAVKALALL